MDKRHERDENLSPRPAAEGVRIIPADEAQAALDAGQAAGRRPDDAPRFGDVPAQPSGPRSPHRFPLPDSVDPASAVPRPPVRPGLRRPGRGAAGRPREQLGTPPPPRVVRLLAPTAAAADDRNDTVAFAGTDARVDAAEEVRHEWPDQPTQASSTGDPDSGGPPAGGAHFASNDPEPMRAENDAEGTEPATEPRPEPEPNDLALPREGITLAAGSGPEMPHWTDPPTGEVPRILPDRDPVPGEELSAWQALGSRGLRWRDEASDWDDLDDVSHLADADDETRLGALDTTRSEHSDMFSFDEQFERLEDERSGQHVAIEPGAPAVGLVGREAPPDQADQAGRRSLRRALPGAGSAVRGSTRRAGGDTAGRMPLRRPGGPNERVLRAGGRDLPSAVVVGVGLLLALLIAYAVGSAALMLLSTAVVTASALELYNLIQHRGFKPATLLGLCATIAVMFAAYWRGEQALPLILALVFITSMLWYLLRVVDARPVVNIGLTVMAFIWVGLFGAYASLVLRGPHGKGILLLAILVTAAADIGAYFAGRALGSRPLAPDTSPGKTWEGTIGGGVAAILAAMIVGQLFLSKTWSISHALLLGLVIAVVAPMGDLCESMVKRDLDLKDSGTALPGHGGLLDRFDALLFVLPATYYLAQYLKLH